MGDKVEDYIPIHVRTEGADGRSGPVPDEPFVVRGAGGIFSMEIRPPAGIGAGRRRFDNDLGSISIHNRWLLSGIRTQENFIDLISGKKQSSSQFKIRGNKRGRT
jgi:hypothetical protein